MTVFANVCNGCNVYWIYGVALYIYVDGLSESVCGTWQAE